MAILVSGTNLLTNCHYDIVFAGKQLETMIHSLGGKEHTPYLQVYQRCLKRAAFGILILQTVNKTQKEQTLIGSTF